MSTPESNGRRDPADAPGFDAHDADAEAGQIGERSEIEIAFTPRQILGGFALLAALLILLRRRARGRSRTD